MASKMNKKAQEYLCKTYPKLCKARWRKNGMSEIALNYNHTFTIVEPELI